MGREFKRGDHVMVNWYDKEDNGIANSYSDEDEVLWVDLKLHDSSPNRIVYTGIELKDCRKPTESELFKHKLQAREIGIYHD